MFQLRASRYLFPLLLARTVFAGPDVIEDVVDAGRLAGTAQDTTTVIVGQPTSITGRLSGAEEPTNPDDYVDAYLVTITTPASFVARTFVTTVASRGGPTSDFDTQLWLFDASGFGLLANDDKTLVDIGSEINTPSTDGTAITIPGPGTYLLAISVKGVIPVSALGAIFDQTASVTEVSGPDGVGGGSALTSWDDTSPATSVPGDYFIEIIPAPATFAIAGAASVVLIRRRR